VCRLAAGICDQAEVCSGSSGMCPSDSKFGAETTCRASAGICDAAEVCDGSSDACGADAKKGAETTCRVSAGICDAAEVCDGSSDECGADAKKGAETTCRASAGICDAAEVCDGSSDACGADAKKGAETTCRASAGVCDAAEVCGGSSDLCGTDAKKGAETTCRASAGVCDAAEVCDGSSDLCGTDAKKGAETTCRVAAGDCDVADVCDGSNDLCGADLTANAGTECRGAQGDCDVAETCDGSSKTCPTDAFLSAATECRAANGGCDVAESCTGSSAACPTDAVEPSSTVCRTQDGPCDVAETCDGSTKACPTDAFASGDTLAFPTRGVCDAPDFCPGDSKLVPLDTTNAGNKCRPSAGVCDPVEEFCQVGSDDCPADVRIPAGTECSPLEGAAACAIFTCGDDGTCNFASSRSPTASCRAPADAQCDVRDRCGVLSYVCSGDLTTPCTTNFAPDDSKCVGNGACAVNPNDPANRTDFTSAWSKIQVTPETTVVFPPANDTEQLYLTEFINYPGCGTDTVQPKDTVCTSDVGPGRCLDGACNRDFCQNTIDCPDGSVCGCPSGEVCETDYCINAPVDGGFGDSCTGVSGQDTGTCSPGFLCCAGMQGSGNGGVAGDGAAGRCAECCSDLGNDCGTGGAQCCDGECTDTESDPGNCLGCDYDGGANCYDLVSACNPGVVRCDNTLSSGCVLEESCQAVADAGGWDAFKCSVPQVRVADPACDYCVWPSGTPGKGCVADEDCGPVGRCFHDQSEFCVLQDYYQAAPGCLEPPYTGCDLQCIELFDTEPAPNVGDPCTSNDDCDGGTTCKSSCNLSELWLTSFCFTDPTCQW